MVFFGKSLHHDVLIKNQQKITFQKNLFSGQKSQIDTAYRLYFLEQPFEIRQKHGLFSAKSVHHDVLIKNQQKITFQRNLFSGQKSQIDTAYRLYFLEQPFEIMQKYGLFSAKSLHNDVLIKN